MPVHTYMLNFHPIFLYLDIQSFCYGYVQLLAYLWVYTNIRAFGPPTHWQSIFWIYNNKNLSILFLKNMVLRKTYLQKDAMVVGKSHAAQSKSYCGLSRFVGLFFTTPCCRIAVFFWVRLFN
jgi:hypothetical protein